MTDRLRFRPFTGDVDRHITMLDPPLVLVLAQIRWPEHAQFNRDFEKLAFDFGDQLEEFPLYNELEEAGVQITPEGIRPFKGQKAYQWRSVDNVWTIHLTRQFVSIYCTKHSDYRFSELRSRLHVVTDLLQSTLHVRSIDRVGVRYVNRISDPRLLSGLDQVFTPAVLGYAQLVVPANVELVSNITHGLYRAEDVLLQTRSGRLGSGETVDPSVPPINKPSWVLDLDAFVERQQILDPNDLFVTAQRLADAAYDFFKLVLIEGAEQRLDGSV